MRGAIPIRRAYSAWLIPNSSIRAESMSRKVSCMGIDYSLASLLTAMENCDRISADNDMRNIRVMSDGGGLRTNETPYR